MPLVSKGKRVAVEQGRTLFDYASELALRVPSSCARNGECHECVVEIRTGHEALSKPTVAESFLANNTYRLACQARISAPDSDIEFTVLRRDLKILTRGLELPNFEPAPLVKRVGNQVFSFEHNGHRGKLLGKYTGRILGIAADIGATSVALNLVDLETGETIYTSAFENPQRFGGSDVLRRISYDAGENRGEMQAVMLSAFNFEIGEMVKALKIRRQQIYQTVVVGNSTMRDIFFGLDVQTIGVKPYRSTIEAEKLAGKRTTTAITTTAKELNLRINASGEVYGAPLIASHVGADATACILASGMYASETPSILVDAGTNTEVIVGNMDKMLAASCPAGPAFEGGLVRHAMPGYEGAISQITLHSNGDIDTQVIGNVHPVGICGSGLIDLLAELRRSGQMDHLGRFADGLDSLAIANSKHLVISRADVSALAQAKAANYCGQSILLKKYGLPIEDFAHLYLAGGFANYISPQNAAAIGFIVDFSQERIQKIGNAALQGATMMLLSGNLRQEMEQFVNTIEHVELENSQDFFDFFVEGCQFKPMEWPINSRDQIAQ